MGVNYLDTLLDNLKTEMEQYIVPGNDFYDTTPTVERGIHYWEDTNGSRPFIWFIAVEGAFEETMSNTTKDEIFIEIHGYADKKSSEDNTMQKLFKDVVYFLMNDYSQPVNLISYILQEGGVNEETQESGFLLNIKVITDFNITTLL